MKNTSWNNRSFVSSQFIKKTEIKLIKIVVRKWTSVSNYFLDDSSSNRNETFESEESWEKLRNDMLELQFMIFHSCDALPMEKRCKTVSQRFFSVCKLTKIFGSYNLNRTFLSQIKKLSLIPFRAHRYTSYVLLEQMWYFNKRKKRVPCVVWILNGYQRNNLFTDWSRTQ